MSLPSYAKALSLFARDRAVSRGSWDRMLKSLCPEFLDKLPSELANCRQPAMLGLFSSLLFQIAQELHDLCGAQGQLLEAKTRAEVYQYQVGALEHVADLRALIELWRFGVCLDLDEPGLDQTLLERALLALKKDVQGAWRVAQRRWKSFSKASGRLHAAGDSLHMQARRVESALSIALSDPKLICTRADLATDWLAGVDLWLHQPKSSSVKGQALALSLLKARAIEEKKADKAAATWLWTPSRLAKCLAQALGAKRADAAQELWVALGKPVDPEQLAQRLRACMLELGKPGRELHPSMQAPQLVAWLRELRLEAK